MWLPVTAARLIGELSSSEDAEPGRMLSVQVRVGVSDVSPGQSQSGAKGDPTTEPLGSMPLRDNEDRRSLESDGRREPWVN